MDSRFSLIATFRIYGKEYKADMSLNWSAESTNEIDHRLTEWFLRCHDEAYGEWEAKNYALQRERREQQEKARELEDLKRLREKYPDA